MKFIVDVEDSSRRRQRQCRELADEGPAAASLEPDVGGARFGDVRRRDDDRSDRRSACVDVEDRDEVSDSSAASRQRMTNYGDVVVSRRCERRKRSSTKQDGRSAELFPVPVVTLSLSSPGGVVGRMLLPWLLSMTSLGLVTSLPVDSDASRSPVKVFDGNTNNADVDGPVIQQSHLAHFLSIHHSNL